MSSLHKKYPFELEPLKYEFDALEPYISAKTVEIHHTRHQQNYVNSLNALIEKNPEYMDWTLEDFLRKEVRISSEIRTEILRNAGGIYNHERYFAGMTPNAPKAPEGELRRAINEYFGSLEEIKAEMKQAALDVFGSGYAYLVVTPQSWLQIIGLCNQETPVAYNYEILATVDVWEHAYYLDYMNLRGDYFDNWWNTIDWKPAEEIYNVIYDKNKKFEFDF